MSRQSGKVVLLLTGAITVFVVEHGVFPGVGKFLREEQWQGKGGVLDQNNVLGKGKTKVYRHDGKHLVRLHEFCTWTVHVDCVMLKTISGATPIHIHDLKVDRFVSGSISKTGSWEPGNVQLLIGELKKDPDLGFMDLGSHVGPYSLSVAKFGRKVVSVDPLIENVQRLCKSIQKGGFTEQMTIIFNPLSDEHTTVNFKREADNVGGTSVISATPGNGSKSPCEESTDSSTVMLDDLIPLIPFKKAVLKMDVQNFEYRVLKGAVNFFKQIHVTAILIEWIMIKNVPDGDKIVKMLVDYKFKPYQPILNGKELDPKAFKSWPYDVLWRRS